MKTQNKQKTKTMPHYLDPKNDLTLKRVFGEHKHLCISLINSMLPLDNPIVSIEYNPNELIPELADILRNTSVDVRCTDAIGRQFIVEMQLYWSESFKNRVLLNASKAYVRQLDKGRNFKLLRPVYALNFVNEIFEKSPEMANEYYHHYKIVNIKDTEKQIEGLEFLFVELPKFKPQNCGEKKLQELWLRFLTEINESTWEVPQELLENDDIREAIGYVEQAAYTKGQLEAYDRWMIDVMTERGILDDAEAKGLAKGLEKGLAKGLKKGLEQGLAKGLAKGKAEIAVTLLKKGFLIEDISDITGLSIQKIEAIQKETE
jgi:predicted transposase/invertase (TIGR01784 family)